MSKVHNWTEKCQIVSYDTMLTIWLDLVHAFIPIGDQMVGNMTTKSPLSSNPSSHTLPWTLLLGLSLVSRLEGKPGLLCLMWRRFILFTKGFIQLILISNSNSGCVKLIQELKELKAEADEAKAKVRKLGAENSALKRKLESIEGGEEMPRPGPRLKPFEDLTPKQERSILPTKLSAFLTYRFGCFSSFPVPITFG